MAMLHGHKQAAYVPMQFGGVSTSLNWQRQTDWNDKKQFMACQRPKVTLGNDACYPCAGRREVFVNSLKGGLGEAG